MDSILFKTISFHNIIKEICEMTTTKTKSGQYNYTHYLSMKEAKHLFYQFSKMFFS